MTKRRLPPLGAVRAFEAAGRQLSFSKGADELNVTQGAVSRQIRMLEDYLGQPLFRRLTRRVELTPFGESYLASVAAALDEIEHATARARSSTRVLSVSILPSTGALWLMERLGSFTSSHPEIRLDVSSSMAPAKLRTGEMDAAIRLGRVPTLRYDADGPQLTFRMTEDWFGVAAIHLWDDFVKPVCSRGLLESGPALGSIADLARYPWIRNTVRPGDWPAWLRAQRAEAVRASEILEFSHSFMAVQAVREGRGIAVVPTIEIEHLAWRDELVHPFPNGVRSSGAYYLLCLEERADTPEIRTFVDWLLTFRPEPGHEHVAR